MLDDVIVIYAGFCLSGLVYLIFSGHTRAKRGRKRGNIELKRSVIGMNELMLGYKNWGAHKDDVLKLANYLNNDYSCVENDNLGAQKILDRLNHSIDIMILLKDEGCREGHKEMMDAKAEFKKYSEQLMQAL